MVLNVMRVLLCVALGLWVSGAHAGSIGVTQQYPDIAVPDNFSQISYDHVTGTFTAIGDPRQYTVGPEESPTIYQFATPESSRSFSLTANLDPSTGSPKWNPSTGYGSLTITGSILDTDNTTVLWSGTLLTATLDQIGFFSALDAAQMGDDWDNGFFDSFDFVYNVTGGLLAPQYGGAGSGKVGLMMIASNSGFTGSFATDDFAAANLATGSTVDAVFYPVPEPSSMALLLLFMATGLVMTAFRRSRMMRCGVTLWKG